MNRLKDKVAIITGSSSGLGRQTAKMFAAEGAKVVVTGRRVDRLEEVVADIRSAGGEAAYVAGDLLEEGTIDKIFDCAKTNYGRVDVVMNNSGIIDLNYSAATVPDDIIEKVMATNFSVPAKVCRRALNEFMAQDGGVIINVSSICGLAGARGGPIYTSSKHAIIGLSKNIAYIFAPKNIRCNVICPGYFQTEVLTRYNGTHRQDPYEAERIDLVQVSAQGIGQGNLEDIGNLAIYLASDESHFVNGAIISADGGWSCI